MQVTVAPAIPLPGGGFKPYEGRADYYCTGVSDEMIINAAIRYVSGAYGGGKVLLLDGVFNLGNPSTWNGIFAGTGIGIDLGYPQVTLEGLGRGTIISCNPATTGIQVSISLGSTDTVLKHFQLKILGASPAPSGIFGSSSGDLTIDDVYINGFYNYGIDVFSAGNVKIINCKIVGGDNGYNTHGIYCASDSMEIVNNRILNFVSANPGYGIYTASTGSGGIIKGNFISDITGSVASAVYGIYVPDDNISVEGNYVTTVKNSNTASLAYGISIVAGASNVSVDSNYCFNNGTDAGIANTNGCNFTDAGTDTQVYSNSWQSPVAGEPSLGTPHPTSDANRTATLVVNTSTNTAGTWSAAVTMTGVPAGAKAAWCMAMISKSATACRLCVEAATGYTLSDITVGTNVFKYFGTGGTNPANLNTFVPIKIHLDANGQFKWCTDVSSSTVQIGSAIDWEC